MRIYSNFSFTNVQKSHTLFTIRNGPHIRATQRIVQLVRQVERQVDLQPVVQQPKLIELELIEPELIEPEVQIIEQEEERVKLIITELPNSNMILIYEIINSNTKIQLPISMIQGELTIDWGDGIIEQNNSYKHTYNSEGNYKIIISKASSADATIGRFGLDYIAEGIQYLVAVESWGNFNTTSFKKAFASAINIVKVPNYLPTNKNNESIVTNMMGMFFDTKLFNQDISNWDVSSATNMSTMFFHATAFNQDISKWNVSAGVNIHAMFAGATSFTEPNKPRIKAARE